jgi:hypothetical protein
MHRTILIVCLLLSGTVAAATRTRITSISYATLEGRVVDAATNAPVTQVEVEGARFFARTDSQGRFTLRLPVGQAIPFAFKRSGYQTLTETITLTGNADRTFHLTTGRIARILTTSGVTHQVDADSVEFGWAVPFSGYRHDRSAPMCRAGGTEFTLDRNEVERIEGPAVTAAETSCCPTTMLTGAVFELATGERFTAYFKDSCNNNIMEVIARDHATYEQVFVPLRDLRELVMP